MLGFHAIRKLNTFLSDMSKITNFISYFVHYILYFLTNLNFPGIKQKDKDVVI